MALKAKILIVEDEASIREGLIDVFIYHGYEVEAVADGKTGLAKFQSGSYHLILLDVMLPEMDGFSLCNAIRKIDRSQPIIMLTAKGDESDIIHGLKQGADDYVTKPFSVAELLARAESVLRRSPKLSLQQSHLLGKDFEVDVHNLTFKQDNKLIPLTRREVEILHYLMYHSERPASRQELLREVWGYKNSLMDTRTVDIHITKLRKKIEADPQNPKYIMTVRNQGYKIGL